MGGDAQGDDIGGKVGAGDGGVFNDGGGKGMKEQKRPALFIILG